jgi:hypothetical protein
MQKYRVGWIQKSIFTKYEINIYFARIREISSQQFREIPRISEINVAKFQSEIWRSLQVTNLLQFSLFGAVAFDFECDPDLHPTVDISFKGAPDLHPTVDTSFKGAPDLLPTHRKPQKFVVAFDSERYPDFRPNIKQVYIGKFVHISCEISPKFRDII